MFSFITCIYCLTLAPTDHVPAARVFVLFLVLFQVCRLRRRRRADSVCTTPANATRSRATGPLLAAQPMAIHQPPIKRSKMFKFHSLFMKTKTGPNIRGRVFGDIFLTSFGRAMREQSSHLRFSLLLPQKISKHNLLCR